MWDGLQPVLSSSRGDGLKPVLHYLDPYEMCGGVASTRMETLLAAMVSRAPCARTHTTTV